MILALNTSTPQFGLALVDHAGVVMGELLLSREKGHFGTLMPALHFLFEKSNALIQELKAVAVTTGPGSFTGLRVGLSAAKGLGHGLGIPVIGIPSLQALAHQVVDSRIPITPILNSRKDELYAAQFVQGKTRELAQTMQDITIKIKDLPLVFDQPSLFIGNDFHSQGVILKEALGPMAQLAPPHCWLIRPSTVGALALNRLHGGALENLQDPDPIYLRPPDIRPSGPCGLTKNVSSH
jgi:tRNA threonylcarbamoyladenosine biosynthesis protein TsaB